MSGDDGGRHGPDDDSESSERSPGVAGVASVRAALASDGLRRQAFGVAREAAISAALVATVGAVLFAASGVWPPMVAVESASMEPNLTRGDLVVISEAGRYVPGQWTEGDTGVVTVASASDTGYRTLGAPGSVVVFRPDGQDGTPVIHRAHLWVEDGENWYDRADQQYVRADSCATLRNCPAPHAGFVTKGDNNPAYDQVLGISGVVRPSWVVGVAHVRVPLLGHVRLELSGAALAPVGPGAAVESGVAGARTAGGTVNATA